MLTLKDLYLDLLVNILSFLRPTEVIVVSKTCKSLRVASQERTVWLQVVQTMMEEHGILPYTYDLDGLGTAMLKNIATSPARFSLMLKNKLGPRSVDAEGCLLPASARVLFGPNRAEAHLGISAVNELHGPLLFPGGRFLSVLREVKLTQGTSDLDNSTTNEPTRTSVQMWDLGTPGSGESTKHVFTKILSKVYARWDIYPNAKDITFDFVAISGDDMQLNVYCLSANDPTVNVTPVNILTTDEPIVAFSCQQDRIAFINQKGQITLWDYRRRLSIGWDIDETLVGSKATTTIYMVEDSLFLVQNDSLYQWSVPELTNQDSFQSVGLRHPTNTISQIFQLTAASSTFLATQHCTWSPHPQTRMAVFDSEHNLALYHLKSPAILPVRIGSSSMSVYVTDKYLHSELRYCNTGIVLCFDVDNSPLVMYMAHDESKPDTFSLTEINLALGFSTTCISISLCPATGRMILLTDDYDVYVIDYL